MTTTSVSQPRSLHSHATISSQQHISLLSQQATLRSPLPTPPTHQCITYRSSTCAIAISNSQSQNTPTISMPQGKPEISSMKSHMPSQLTSSTPPFFFPQVRSTMTHHHPQRIKPCFTSYWTIWTQNCRPSSAVSIPNSAHMSSRRSSRRFRRQRRDNFRLIRHSKKSASTNGTQQPNSSVTLPPHSVTSNPSLQTCPTNHLHHNTGDSRSP